MADYLNRTFPCRLHLTIGSSLNTLPRFAAEHCDVKCDVIVVDGGHTLGVALGDIRNFRVLANVGHVLLVDDTNNSQVRSAWKRVRSEGMVVQRFSCSDREVFQRKYAVGYYV